MSETKQEKHIPVYEIEADYKFQWSGAYVAVNDLDDVIAAFADKCDAEHFVKCVNSHDVLINALTRLVSAQSLGSEQSDIEEKQAALRQAEEALKQVGVL